MQTLNIILIISRLCNKKTAIVLLVIGLVSNIYAQTTLNFKIAPFSIHPFNEKNSHIFENKIDANGIFVSEPCLILGSETFLREDVFSLRFMLGGLSDAASKPAMFFHTGLKLRFFQVWRSSFAFGLGGNIYGRELWSNIDGYVKESGWSPNGNWEYKLGIMAEFEYVLLLAQRHDLTFSLIYGHQPREFTLTVGYRFWLSTTLKNPKPCGSCPFGKKSKKKWHF